MPGQASRDAQDAAGSAATALEGAVWDALGLRDAVEGARLEAERSGLPGLSGGPGDTYRHLLISGEMKRRFGRTLAERFADLHEVVNDIERSQTEQDRQMDHHNNLLGAGAPAHEIWEDVVAWARGMVEEAARHDGDGQDGRAIWHDKQPPGWRPDFTDLPITPIEKGGPEHRYDADEEGAVPDASLPSSTSADPLDRPVASWTEEDVRTIMNSPAYLEARHPRHLQAQRDVRVWFERRFGAGPVPVDATGRAIHGARETTARAGACPVPVRAHNRGKVEVAAHCRSAPAG